MKTLNIKTVLTGLALMMIAIYQANAGTSRYTIYGYCIVKQQQEYGLVKVTNLGDLQGDSGFDCQNAWNNITRLCNEKASMNGFNVEETKPELIKNISKIHNSLRIYRSNTKIGVESIDSDSYIFGKFKSSKEIIQADSDIEMDYVDPKNVSSGGDCETNLAAPLDQSPTIESYNIGG